MVIEDIATIQPGLPFRSRIEADAMGEFVVIQARDLGPDGCVRLDGAARLRSLPAFPRGGYLKTGDILLQPRGTRFTAAVIERVESPSVAAAPLWILRVDLSRTFPAFLVAVLMSPATQASLRQAAAGTYVPQVPRHAIEGLPIELPDLSSQIKLADLARLEQRERELTERLRQARGRLFDLAVKQAARMPQRRTRAHD
jgi:hypothetical protein